MIDMQDFLWVLSGLFISALTSATILPGTSDVALIAVIWQYPEWAWQAWLVAGVGNSLGGMISYWMGRMLPEKYQSKMTVCVLYFAQRYGVYGLLLSWLPIIGDALPIVAGWLRLNAWYSLLAIAVGKFARYALIIAGVSGLNVLF